MATAAEVLADLDRKLQHLENDIVETRYLLKDPHPGLAMWWETLHVRINRLRNLTHELDKLPGG